MDDQERWYADNLPLRDQVIVDVGANVGRLSQFFWDASGGSSRVVSVEPVPENVALIRKRIAEAGAKGWTVEPCAVSDREGTVPMNVFRMPEGPMNSVVQSTDAETTTVEVPARPLSALVPDATVVKVDIEGHEYGVLAEALPKLTRVQSWTVEFHLVEGQPLQGALQRFADHGFRIRAAGRHPKNPTGPWIAAEVPPSLGWDRIPVAQTRADGSVFKMLHIIADRR